MKTTARILVIDDDDHVREALVDELSPFYRVEALGSAAEALEVLATEQFDVVISDLKMPEHDGIEVLEFARAHQRDAVRVLLTGYLDERAQQALLLPEAPYKVGKPWHDEIEVVVRRGLEQRELARRLSASVEDALSLSTFDEELAATKTFSEMTDALMRRVLAVKGVMACGTTVRIDGREQALSGSSVPQTGAGWLLDVPLDEEGDVRLRARGVGDSSRQVVSYMAHRAQRRCGVLEARVVASHGESGTGTRINQLMRQATLGALSSSLLHDLAATMQALSGALGELSMMADDQPDLRAAVSDATAAGEDAIQLFVQMRKFIKGGTVETRRMTLRTMIDRAVKLVGGYVRERARLVVEELPAVEIAVSEALFLQVLGNLLRNAANASPRDGTISVSARSTGHEIALSVVDDGPGVDLQIADHMFEPFTTTGGEGTGLGLAISSFVMQMFGGRISYRRHPQRGACFTVVLPMEHHA